MSHPRYHNIPENPTNPLELYPREISDTTLAPESQPVSETAEHLGATGLSEGKIVEKPAAISEGDSREEDLPLEAVFSGTLPSLEEEAPKEARESKKVTSTTETEPKPEKEQPSIREIVGKAVGKTLTIEVDKKAAEIRTQLAKRGMTQEPAYGYWNALGGARADTEYQNKQQELEARRAAAADRPEAEQTTIDKIALSRGQSYDPYHYLARKITESLRDETGELPELEDLVTDTADLEGVTKWFVLDGVSRQSHNHKQGGDLTLYDALALMTEATKKVPDFDPWNAGLGELWDHTIFQRAVLKIESPHYSQVRMGAHSQGDAAAAMVWACSDALKETYTEMQMREINAGRMVVRRKEDSAS